MATPAQAMNTALMLVGQAADLLDSVDDHAGAVRLRHTLAVLRYDDGFVPPNEDLRIPLTLMRMALALMDKNGGSTMAACSLQDAIDRARGATALKPGDTLDPALLAIFDHDCQVERRA